MYFSYRIYVSSFPNKLLLFNRELIESAMRFLWHLGFLFRALQSYDPWMHLIVGPLLGWNLAEYWLIKYGTSNLFALQPISRDIEKWIGRALDQGQERLRLRMRKKGFKRGQGAEKQTWRDIKRLRSREGRSKD